MPQEELSHSGNNIFSKYIDTRNHYYKNMEQTVNKEEYRKASELLWGAVTQSIKALASLSGIMISQHKFFRTYTRDVAREIGDIEYHELFLTLETLHRNFYDEKIDPIDFPLYLEKANKFLEKTEQLIQKKLEQLKRNTNQHSNIGNQ